jgi:hypothetical protein
MNKGLEALDNLVNHINLLNHINGVEQQEVFEPLVNKNKSIIEKELKRLEELEKAFDALSKDDEKSKKLLSKEIEKNRALEIIKKKSVDIKYLRYRAEFNVEKYNDNYIETLTKEECDLLKEVLL